MHDLGNSPVLTARSLMTSPVCTVDAIASISEAQKSMVRVGHSNLCVLNSQGQLLGIVSRRDTDVAVRHGFGQAPVTSCLNMQLKTATPDMSVLQIHQLMATYGVDVLPVLEVEKLVGIITISDVLSVNAPGQKSAGSASSSSRALFGHSDLLPSSARMPSAQVLYQQLETRLPAAWPALQLMAAEAENKGWALYVVGGAVRDLLLSLSGQPHPLTDIDLVVEGAEEGAGVRLAELIQLRWANAQLQTYGQFQTAALTLPVSQTLGQHVAPEGQSSGKVSALSEPGDTSQAKISIDIATARTETYPYPAANPDVESSNIHQDLCRRDFTINAMALCLTQTGWNGAQLLDFFGGWPDLQQRQMRVLHANSFIEDPTRIFRAVRFAARLDFDLEPRTAQLITDAVGRGLYADMQASALKTPALQSRLKAEVQALLVSELWQISLAKLDALGALVCLHPHLTVTRKLWSQLRRAKRWFNKLEHRLDMQVPVWLMQLELLLAQLSPTDAVQVSARLGLGEKSCCRLQNLHRWELELCQQLTNCSKPSCRYRLFHSYSSTELLLMANRHPYTLGQHIWHYIIHLSQVSLLVSGATLKRLGYSPGPQFKTILNDVHQRQLDGELSNIQSAERYVLAHYSR